MANDTIPAFTVRSVYYNQAACLIYITPVLYDYSRCVLACKKAIYTVRERGGHNIVNRFIVSNDKYLKVQFPLAAAAAAASTSTAADDASSISK